MLWDTRVIELLCISIYNNIRYSLTKRISFFSSFKALSTDTSFIKIGVCQQKLLTLELNFHYRFSNHYHNRYQEVNLPLIISDTV